MNKKEFEEMGGASVVMNYMGMVTNQPAIKLSFDIIKPLYAKGFTREQFMEWFEVPEKENERKFADMIILAAFNNVEYLAEKNKND